MARLGADHFHVLTLKAEIELAQHDYPAALSRYSVYIPHGSIYASSCLGVHIKLTNV